MEANRPDAVVLAAGRVGGIVANSSLPGDFIYDNLAIATNVIHAARGCGVARLLYLGSSCIYPKLADQPLTESALLTGPLEPSNRVVCRRQDRRRSSCVRPIGFSTACDFISAMPTNLYGPGDNFDPVNSHVVPGLMARIDRALAEGADGVRIWGSGMPRRTSFMSTTLPMPPSSCSGITPATCLSTSGRDRTFRCWISGGTAGRDDQLAGPVRLRSLQAGQSAPQGPGHRRSQVARLGRSGRRCATALPRPTAGTGRPERGTCAAALRSADRPAPPRAAASAALISSAGSTA